MESSLFLYMKGKKMLFEKIIVRLLRILSFVMFTAMIIIVFAQVMLRYFFGAPLAWSDELSRLLLVWVSFMGVTLVHYSSSGHPAVNFLVDKLSINSKEKLSIVLNILMVVCFIALCWAGLMYTMRNHRFVSAVLHYPNSVKYAIVPFSMALMAVKSFQRIIDDFKALKKNSSEEA